MNSRIIKSEGRYICNGEMFFEDDAVEGLAKKMRYQVDQGRGLTRGFEVISGFEGSLSEDERKRFFESYWGKPLAKPAQ